MMNQDPYAVLGIHTNASNEEVKKAYRELAKQYHPDRYANNPLSNLAAEKFQEIQQAYDTIMSMRNNGYANDYNSTTTGNSGYGNYDNSSYQQGNYRYGSGQGADYSMVNSYIQMGRYQEALNLLTRMPNQDGQWNYYMAICYKGMGRDLDAISHARDAAAMEPNNVAFRQLLNSLNQPSAQYNSRQDVYGGGNMGCAEADCCDCCSQLWCLDTMCECMGGDLCSCM